MAVLIIAGIQLPLMPLLDVDGSEGGLALIHSGPTGLKAGVIAGLTVTVRVVVDAHRPAAGVNV